MNVKIWGPSDDPVTLQQSLLSLENWVSENGMVLNTSKCEGAPHSHTIALNRYYLGDELELIHQSVHLHFNLEKDLEEYYLIRFGAPRPTVGKWQFEPVDP